MFRSKHHRCFACDLSHDVYVQSGRRENWYLNYDEDNNALCSRCYQTIIKRPRKFRTSAERNAYNSQIHKGIAPPNKGKRLEYNRECYACGSTTTYVGKTGKRQWMINHDGNVLCHRCKMRYIMNPRSKPRYRFAYKDRNVYLDYNPRTGFCSQCGRTGITHLHHTKYGDDDPLANTIELCVECHSKRSWDLLIEKRAQELFTKWKEGTTA